jgi:hypothetical protein
MIPPVLVEGVKGMLDDQAIGGGELTVARGLKEEFYNLLLKKIEKYAAQSAAPELLHNTSGANFSWSNARLIPSGAKRLQARSLT